MKKTELIMFAGILMVLSLTGCAPRVLTEVTMNYPARSVEEVRVYDVGDTVPNSAVAIGKVAVLDRGFTTNCGYDRMLGLAKERTAENGGNGLLLTEHMFEGKHFDFCIMYKDRHILEDSLIHSLDQKAATL